MTARIADVRQAVAAWFRLAEDDLTGPSRSAIVAQPRQLGYLLAHEVTGKSLPQIAAAFGREDHTCVLHGIKQSKERMREHEIWRRHYRALKSRFA